MKKVFIDKVELRVDDEGEIYVGQCRECDQPLTGEEMAYGHECEDI